MDRWNAPASAELVTIGGGDVAQVSSLPPEVAEAFGISLELDTVTRKQAMSIPTVANGRNIIAGTIGSFALVDTRGGGAQVVRRPLLEQTDPDATNPWTLTWTVDDLMFHGIAWWHTLELDRQNYPMHAERVEPGRVRVDAAAGVVTLDGREAKPRELIRFDGPHEGLLTIGRVALKTALMLEAAARRYAVADAPVGWLRDTRADGADLTRDEVAELLARWRTLRAQDGTGWLNRSIDYEPNTGAWKPAELQLVEARQHSALDLARLMGLDAQSVNAPAATGMTYNNGQELRRGRLDGPLRPYMSAITSRLTMPDVTPAGHAVTFDTAAWLLGGALERVETAVAAAGRPVMDVDEARAIYLGLPPNPALTATPASEDTP